MELKKLYFIVVIIFCGTDLLAENVKPNKNLSPYDVVKIQLEALKNNDKNDKGIEQTWIFAHPNNKKVTDLWI